MDFNLDASIVDQTHDMAMSVGEDASQYLTFFLGEEEYGINILDVQEIKGWDGTTIIPNTPEHILGVINLRGTIVPVIELRTCFSLPHKAFTETTVVIMIKVVADGEERVVGVVVDAVAEVYNVAFEAIEPPPNVHASVDAEYIKGLTTLDEKMVILLDISTLLAEQALDDQPVKVH
ncbi:MAG TPA: chemotaxis protein CheW [Gammaproteobacteria bacterium]|jgi:purine-binding chemotaxis protein CheW|nr:chemotaxis protein CheW [Gammaproteobacteria bacterium]